ncbi:apolipoprotein Da, duplicate 2 [Colossoma macropomum]|uniref:apolipoprotein Da, duplicate 2 n=1 Tax=Colossoma macropomum TaxID=42526 RepID=UPI00186546DF|nr:apolipoprotein Da, duplicate 2 [Colossoma macropomum]
MMKALQVFSLALLSVLAVSGRMFHSGRCPTPPVQQNFDPTQYVGRWYEIQKLPNAFQKGECAQATYTLQDGVVLVLNQELLADGTVSSIEGTAKPKDPSEPAKLEVSFFEGVPPGNYWVLSTDYENYSLVFGCSDYLGLFHVEFAWILSRSRSLPKETLSELQDILTSNGINIDTLTSTDQDPGRCSSMPQ